VRLKLIILSFLIIILTFFSFPYKLKNTDSIIKTNYSEEKRVELISKRTKYSKTFLNSSGSKTLEVSLEPIHFKDEKGEWKEINNEIVLKRQEDCYENIANSFKVKFPLKVKENEPIVKFSFKDINISIIPLSIEDNIKVTKNQTSIIYKNIWNGVDLIYEIKNSKLKEYIIVNSLETTLSLNFQYQIDGEYKISKDEKGNLEIVTIDGNKIIIPKLYSFDSSKEMKLFEPDINIDVSENSIKISININPDQINKEDLIFPLIIDPVLEPWEPENPEDIARDSYVYWRHYKQTICCPPREIDRYEGFNENKGTDKKLKVGSWQKKDKLGNIIDEGEARTYIYFPLPLDELNGKYISSSYIKFKYVSGDSPKVKVFEPQNSWEETAITWNNQPSLFYSTTSTFFIDSSDGLYRYIFVTPMIQRIAWNQFNYYGFAIVTSEDIIDGPTIELGSREYTEGTPPQIPIPYPPTIVINYLDKYGVDNNEYIKKFDLFENNFFYINLYNGNLIVQSEDFNIKSIGGLELKLLRTYNSLDEAYSRFGNGWTSNLDQKLIKTVDKIPTYTYIDADGTGYRFEPFISQVKPIPIYYYTFANYAPISFDPTNNKVNSPDGTYIKFDSNGIPIEFGNRKSKINFINSQGIITGLQETGTNPRSIQTQLTNGYRTKTIDPLGRFYTYIYDSNGNLISVTDPLGNITHYTYDSNNLLISISDPNGNITNFTYNDKRQVINVTDSLGNIWNINYDFENHMATLVDPSGYTFHYFFNLDGTLFKKIDHLNNSVTYEYDTRLRIVRITDANGNITTFSYPNDNERISEIVDPFGKKTKYEYDSNNNLIKYTDKKGRITTFTYSQDGADLLSIKDNINRTTTFTYDSNHNLSTKTLPNGKVYKYFYDSEGNYLTKIIDPLNNIYQYTYDEVGNLLTYKDPLNNITSYAYNSKNRLISVTDSLGNTSIFSYDGNGNLISITDPLGNIKSIVYDSLNRKIEEIDPNGNSIHYTYNPIGQTTSIIDQNNHTFNFEYNEINRLISLTDPAGCIIQYQYDDNGNIISVSDNNELEKIFTYDALNRNISFTDSDSTIIYYTYDDVGNLISQKNPDNSTISILYDNANRITRKSYPDGTNINYSYDLVDNLTNITFSLGNYNLTFDALNRLTSMKDPFNLTTSFTYTPLSSISTSTTPFSSTSYSYDNKNRLIQTNLETNNNVSYSYDVGDRLTTLTYPNSTFTTFTYDSNSRITRELMLRDPLNPISLYDLSFTYDNKGNITSYNINNETTTYSYDEKDQLISVIYPDNSTTTYSYDSKGNLITEIKDSETINYLYSDYKLISILDSSSTKTLSYDTNGNIISISDSLNGTRTLTYDYENRIKIITLEDGRVIKYYYDPLNRLIKREINNTKYLYHYLGRSKLLYSITDINNNPIIVFQYDSNGLPISLKYNGLRYYFHFNPHGDLISITDENGEIVSSFSYSPWGELIYINNPVDIPIPFLYLGMYGVIYDSDTNLYLMGKRWYSPILKRFISKDPILNLSDPFSLNPYIYSRNNPINVIDPEGEFPINGFKYEDINNDVLNAINEFLGSNYTTNDIDWVIWYENNGKIIIVGVSVKEGETIKWNEKTFESIQVGDLNKGLTLHYWYNKDKIKSFSIGLRNPKSEVLYFALLATLLLAIPSISSMFIRAILAGISWALPFLENSTLAISVSVIYKNGNAVSSTAFYSDFNFLNVITIYGYGYGSWRNINIDYWRYHP